MAGDRSDEYRRLLIRWERLKAEHEALMRESERLRAQLAEQQARAIPTERTTFVEHFGVLWRIAEGGTADSIAYCLNCRRPLLAYPSQSNELLWCATCGFVAKELKPQDVPKRASQVKP